MSDEPKLFRVRPEIPEFTWDPITTTELVGALFAEVKASAPDNPEAPETEWYCPNPDCAVREIRVRALYDEPPRRSPAMRCPGCRAPLEFHHYLKTITLLPEMTHVEHRDP